MTASYRRSTRSAECSETELFVLNLTVRTTNGGDPLLSSVSLAVWPNECVGLIGASGAGKTQLLFAALGVLKPGTKLEAGTTALFGRPLVGPTSVQAEPIGRAPLCFIAQDPFSAFVPHVHLGEQIGRFVAFKRGISCSAAVTKLMSLLPRLGFRDPPTICRSYPGELSGGMLQRLQAAMAVLARPRLIVADEPTASLDSGSARTIVRELATLRAETKCALLVASHDLSLIDELCDVVYVLDQGQILESGSPDLLRANPSNKVTELLLSAPARLQAERLQE